MRRRQNVMWSLARVGLLCLVAGMVDAYGYMTLGHVFAANMTGNTVLLAIAAVSGELASSVNYALTLCAFAAGAVFGAALKRASSRPYVPLLLAALLLAATGFAAPGRGMLGAIAIVMGLQAASVSKFGATTLQTVVITGPIVRLAEGLVDLLWPGKGADARAAADASAHNGLAWIAYGAGAVLGASGVVFLGGPPLLLAVPALLLLAAAAELAIEPQGR
ncbi:MAG: YoaK family protein [Stellaceae bacterium]